MLGASGARPSVAVDEGLDYLLACLVLGSRAELGWLCLGGMRRENLVCVEDIREFCKITTITMSTCAGYESEWLGGAFGGYQRV